MTIGEEEDSHLEPTKRVIHMRQRCRDTAQQPPVHVFKTLAEQQVFFEMMSFWNLSSCQSSTGMHCSADSLSSSGMRM